MIISDIDRKFIHKILTEFYPDANFMVFGSRVKNKAKHNSDIDIAIDAGEKLDTSSLFQMNNKFEESDLLYKVDLCDFHRISDEFQKHILAHYEDL